MGGTFADDTGLGVALSTDTHICVDAARSDKSRACWHRAVCTVGGAQLDLPLLKSLLEVSSQKDVDGLQRDVLSTATRRK